MYETIAKTRSIYLGTLIFLYFQWLFCYLNSKLQDQHVFLMDKVSMKAVYLLKDRCVGIDSKQSHKGGFQLVLNYSSVSGSDEDIIAYANHAHAVGFKLIWSLKDLWAKPDTTIVKKFIALVKNNPASGDTI